MDSPPKKSNKIRDIVRLQQILKKWRKLANASKTNISNNNCAGSKSIKFLKRTLSISENSVPKGYLAVCVGEEQRRYKIPMEYLSHQAFRVLLQEAEEEFGFQQTGVLRIPCEVAVFDSILKMIEEKKDDYLLQECRYSADETLVYHPPDCPFTPSHYPRSPMCR